MLGCLRRDHCPQRISRCPLHRCEPPPPRFRRHQMPDGHRERHRQAEQPQRAGAEPLHRLACSERRDGEGDAPAHRERTLVAAAQFRRGEIATIVEATGKPTTSPTVQKAVPALYTIKLPPMALMPYPRPNRAAESASSQARSKRWRRAERIGCRNTTPAQFTAIRNAYAEGPTVSGHVDRQGELPLDEDGQRREVKEEEREEGPSANTLSSPRTAASCTTCFGRVSGTRKNTMAAAAIDVQPSARKSATKLRSATNPPTTRPSESARLTAQYTRP